MAKIKNNKQWHGTDANIIVSLFEYGLLVRYVPEEKAGNVSIAIPMIRQDSPMVGKMNGI